jgi:hypothetical protein
MAMKKRAKKSARKGKPVVRRSARLLKEKRARVTLKRPVTRSAQSKRSTATPATARSFVRGVELPQPRVTRDGTAEAMTLAEMGFDTAKNQAAVVGSEIQSFVTGVTAERRDALANSSLLAQLLAKKAVPDPTNIDAWYQVYFDTLTQVGWNIQELDFKQYREESESFNAHEAILKVAATLLSGAPPAALALVKTTLEALQSMDAGNPWITIFSRESQSARVARFQVSLAEQDPAGQFLVRTMAFALEARSAITQVLFFKARSSEAELRYHAGKVTINAGVLDAVSADLKAKLAAHARNFIRTLPDL